MTTSLAKHFSALTASKWQCSTCRSPNDNDKYKCEACESDRPGYAEGKQNDKQGKAAPAGSNGFTGFTFTFGAARLAAADKKDSDSLSPKPAAGFSFGADPPAAKIDDKPKTAPSFSFGTKKKEDPSKSSGFKFGSAAKASEPTFSFGSTPPFSETSTSFFFAAPTPAPKSLQKKEKEEEDDEVEEAKPGKRSRSRDDSTLKHAPAEKKTKEISQQQSFARCNDMILGAYQSVAKMEQEIVDLTMKVSCEKNALICLQKSVRSCENEVTVELSAWKYLGKEVETTSSSQIDIQKYFRECCSKLGMEVLETRRGLVRFRKLSLSNPPEESSEAAGS